MTSRTTRYLYLTRHGEASPDESELTPKGRRQAVLLGERLRQRPLSSVRYGPLRRTQQTAELICDRLQCVPVRSEAAGDYIPYLPKRDELPADSADDLLDRLAMFPREEREGGPRLASTALQQFTGPVVGSEPRHELIVTHNFLIAWLVRAALDAPNWRWTGLNHANAALTVIRYTPGRPAALLVYNDMGHLPAELRWTGFPSEFQM